MLGVSIGPLVVLVVFALCLRHRSRQRAEDIRRLLAGPRPKPDSWHPAISVNGDKRHGTTTMAAPGLLLLLAGMFLAGAWSRERSYATGGGDPNLVAHAKGNAGAPVVGMDASHGQFDARLAELKNKPTLANVVYFDTLPVNESHRSEVVAALETAANGESKSAAFQARETLKRWKHGN